LLAGGKGEGQNQEADEGGFAAVAVVVVVRLAPQEEGFKVRVHELRRRTRALALRRTTDAVVSGPAAVSANATKRSRKG